VALLIASLAVPEAALAQDARPLVSKPAPITAAPLEPGAQPSVAPAAGSNQSPAASQPAQPTDQQLRSFAATFQANVLKGCLQKPPAIANPQAYCSCYAASFLRRYRPLDLLAINSFAARLPQSVSLVTVMMAPERQACLTPNR
jgi:hypothetical protein